MGEKRVFGRVGLCDNKEQHRGGGFSRDPIKTMTNVMIWRAEDEEEGTAQRDCESPTMTTDLVGHCFVVYE